MGKQLSVKEYSERKSNGEPINRYGYYSADYCRQTGLPMYRSKEEYAPLAQIFLSKTRCMAQGRLVSASEKPIAFYRVMNGYCPLYDRREQTEEENSNEQQTKRG